MAVAGEYKFAEYFYIGMDLGYAISTSTYWDGGVYWQSKLGYNANTYQIYGYYKGILDTETITSLGLGAVYKF